MLKTVFFFPVFIRLDLSVSTCVEVHAVEVGDWQGGPLVIWKPIAVLKSAGISHIFPARCNQKSSEKHCKAHHDVLFCSCLLHDSWYCLVWLFESLPLGFACGNGRGNLTSILKAGCFELKATGSRLDSLFIIRMETYQLQISYVRIK